MNHWYVYTGRDLIFGRGRIIQQIIVDTKAVARLIATANKTANFHTNIPSATYVATLLAPLAMDELGEATQDNTNFSSLKPIYNLFDGLNIEQVAINFLNGRVTSNYNADNIAEQAAQGFASGELLFLPRDSAQLYSPETNNKLLGILAFLLTKSESQHKAFTAYLRRGTPPLLDSQDYIKIANSRPTLPSFAGELRAEKSVPQRGAYVC